jgi:ubiquinol-cytochrome c reductase cytochrome b subunit
MLNEKQPIFNEIKNYNKFYITKNIIKKNRLGIQSSILNVLKNHLVYYPTPINLFYVWGLGSLLGIMLIIQVLTGVLLAMHYTPHIDLAFESVERIMREVPNGWLLRYLHANGSSMIFILIFAHMARGIYYQSFRAPKQWVWCSGVVIFILMAGIAFLGYTLPWGQMSFWGATVITNIVTSIPVVGEDIVAWIWGGFSINNNTLNRFFSLHYFLSIIVLGLSLLHLILLHEVGSTSPNGRKSNLDHTKFFPYFYLKDLSTFLFFLFFYLIIVFYAPNLFGHPDNYIRASALVTPAHIVPEWYFLPFYAMLKSFPSKLGGAICMIGSMLILFTLPWTTENGLKIVDPKYQLGYEFMFMLFVLDMLLLGRFGSLPVSENTLGLSQFCTAFYYFYFIVFLPLYSQVEKQISIYIFNQERKLTK